MYIAIDIGGTKTLIAAYSEDGKILRSYKNQTAKKFDDFVKNTISHVEKIAGDDRIDAIAIAAPALMDLETGIARTFGNLDWHDVDIVTPLKEAFNDDVYIDNDAKLGALGEANMGAGQNYETCMYVTISTGIGIGVTNDGKIDKALHNSEAGWMKFMHDGKLVAWEKMASGKAFLAEFGMTGEDDDNPDDWKAWTEDVGIGMLALVSTIQPDVVIIGGSMGNHLHKYHGYLQDFIQNNRAPIVGMPVIVRAQFPDEAVINGCYILCKQQAQD